MKFSIFWLILVCSAFADIKSTNGTISFDVNSDSTPEMILNSQGLGIGISPSSNLHLAGNMIITHNLNIGGGTGDANLFINGSLAFSSQTVSSNIVLTDASVYLVDSTGAGGNLWLDLPYAGNTSGRHITLKKMSNDHRVTLTAASNIDDSTALVLSSSLNAYPYLSVISDGSRWRQLSYSNLTTSSTQPNSISGLALWLDANNGASITYGATGNVSAWNDLSGNNRHATQASSSNQPVYVKKIINGLPALSCDEDQLNVSAGLGIAANADRTILIVAIPESAHNNSEIFGTSTGTMIDLGTFSSVDRLRLRDTSHDGDLYSTTGTIPYDQPNLISITATSGNTQAYHGNTAIISTTNEHAHFDLSASVGIGGASFAGRRFHGYIGEFIVYSKVLNATELNQVWQYLSAKWGIDL